MKKNSQELTAQYKQFLAKYNQNIQAGNYRQIIEETSELLLYSNSFSGQQMHDLYLMRGQARSFSQDRQNAVTDFEQAIKFNSQNQQAFFLLGREMKVMQKFAEAIKHFDEAQRLGCNRTDLFLIRGQAKYNTKDFQGALVDLKKVTGLDSKNGVAFYELGNVQLALKDFDESLKSYNIAEQLGYRDTYLFLARGKAKFDKKDYVGALGDFEQLIKQDSKNKQVFYWCGCCKRYLSKYEEAIKYFNEAQKLGLKSSALFQFRGMCYQSMRMYDEAVKDLNEAIILDPKNKAALASRCFVKLEKGDDKGASLDLEKIQQLDLEFFNVIKQQCEKIKIDKEELSRKQDKLKMLQTVTAEMESKLKEKKASVTAKEEGVFKALDVLAQTFNNLQKTLEQVDQALGGEFLDSPLNIYIQVKNFMVTGVAYMRLGKYQDALDNFKKVVELVPDNAIVWFQCGVLKAELGDYEGSLNDIEKAIQLGYQDTFTFQCLGISRANLDKHADALVAFNQAIQIDGTNIYAITERGHVKQLMGDYEGAFLDYDLAIKLGLKTEVIFAKRGDVNQKLEKHRDAIADYTSAITMNSNIQLLVVLNRGYSFMNIGDYTNAINDFTKVIDLDPKFRFAFIYRGQCYQASKNYESAKKDFEKAFVMFNDLLQIEPKSVIAYIGLAWAKLGLGKSNKEIMEFFDMAISLEPQRADSYFERGLAKKLLNDTDGAELDFAKAISLQPSLRYKVNARSGLDKTVQLVSNSELQYSRFFPPEDNNREIGTSLSSDLQKLWVENRKN